MTENLLHSAKQVKATTKESITWSYHLKLLKEAAIDCSLQMCLYPKNCRYFDASDGKKVGVNGMRKHYRGTHKSYSRAVAGKNIRYSLDQRTTTGIITPVNLQIDNGSTPITETKAAKDRETS